MIVIEVVFEASSNTRNDFIGLMRRTMTASQRENGCVLYRFTADLEFPNRFILTELWENEEGLKAHFAGEAFKNFFAKLPGKGGIAGYTAWQGPLVSYAPPNQTGWPGRSELSCSRRNENLTQQMEGCARTTRSFVEEHSNIL